MNFNVRQKKVINADDADILCLSAAASGKTRVLTERIRVLIEEKGVAPQDIVAISFTNLAADEMKRRLGKTSEGMFIGTIHSYANTICHMNGVNTSKFIDDEEFDKILKAAIYIPKDRYPKIQHLLVDECQDLSTLEHRFLDCIPTANRFLVGDDRQCVYSFKGVDEKIIRNIHKNEDVKKYYLVENYRNAPNIMNFANDFLSNYRQLSPPSVAIKKKDGIVEKTNFDDALDVLDDSGDWGHWFILTRTNKELAEVQRRLDNREIPNITFKKADLDNSELDQLMASDKVKVLTIHSAKGLQAPKVIVIGAKLYNLEERKIAYVAATRAESVLYWCPAIKVAAAKKPAAKKNTFREGFF